MAGTLGSATLGTGTLGGATSATPTSAGEYAYHYWKLWRKRLA